MSFVVAAFFLRAAAPRRLVVPVALDRIAHGPLAALVFLARALSVAVFVLLIIAGLIGAQSPFDNITPLAVWVVWWIGFAYVSALLGNLWDLVNPWPVLFRWAEALWRRLRPGSKLSLELPYPRRLGVWPAVVLFLVFAWMELVWTGSEVPRQLSLAIIGYSILTWCGMWLFGRETWRRRGEVFTVVFGLFARFAPLEGRRTDAGSPVLHIRPYAAGLLPKRPVAPSMMVFVLVVMATVTFDGFIETPVWRSLFDAVVAVEALHPPLLALRSAGLDAEGALLGIALLLFPLLFIALYLAFARLMVVAVRRAGGGTPPTVGLVARLFVLSLVPIAIAYHVAHYLSYLLIAGQFIIPLASDPFGFGWNLFGTLDYRVDIGIVDARFVWLTAVVTIVLGHIIAVYLAHVTALRAFADGRVALSSQIPMLVLMVGYTVTSLSILAQPVVAG